MDLERFFSQGRYPTMPSDDTLIKLFETNRHIVLPNFTYLGTRYKGFVVKHEGIHYIVFDTNYKPHLSSRTFWQFTKETWPAVFEEYKSLLAPRFKSVVVDYSDV